MAPLVTALAPPPFPFTPLIAAASALHDPRYEILAVIAMGRVLRFTIVGLLAIWLGQRILKLAETPAFEWSMAAFIVLCIVGSATSIYNWLLRSR